MVYDQSTILPFVNEKPLGTKNQDGEIVQEGAYGRIFSFEIVEEYQNLPERSTPLLWRILTDKSSSMLKACRSLPGKS